MRARYVVVYVSENSLSLNPGGRVAGTVRIAVGAKADRLGARDLEVEMVQFMNPEIISGVSVGRMVFDLVNDDLPDDLASCLYAEAISALKDVGIHAVGLRAE